MKPLMIASLLLLSACVSQQEIEARRAAEDDAWCASAGISKSDPRHWDCRRYAAQKRAHDEARGNAMFLGLMGAAARANPPSYSPPPRQPMTCIQQGVFTNCY